MRTFVINMKSEKNRLGAIDKQLSSLKITYEVFPAVVGKNLTNKEIEEVYDKKKSIETLGHELTLGEIGCSLSHMGIYKKMVAENIPIALILEDDAIISPILKKIYKKLDKKTIKQLNNGFDYMTMNYSLINYKKFVDYIKYATHKFYIDREYFKIFIHLFGSIMFFILDQLFNFLGNLFGPIIIRKYKPLYLTGGYFITLQGARKLLGVHDKVFVQADLIQELFYKHIGLKFGCIFPLIIKQNENFETQITGRDGATLIQSKL